MIQYTYRNNTDAKADVLVDGYFNDSPLRVGDVIEIVANDGHTMAIVETPTLPTNTDTVLREIVFV